MRIPAFAYTRGKTALLAPFLTSTWSLLDFGCGDLSLSRALKDRYPAMSVTGIDVVDSKIRYPDIDFTTYDGTTLPYGDSSFDTAVSYHVLHHTENPKKALAELARVTKKTVLVVEPVYRHQTDLFFMKLLDRIFNGWRSVTIPMPFTFQTERTWRTWAHHLGLSVVAVKSAGVFPDWMPIGVTKLFVYTHEKN